MPDATYPLTLYLGEKTAVADSFATAAAGSATAADASATAAAASAASAAGVLAGPARQRAQARLREWLFQPARRALSHPEAVAAGQAARDQAQRILGRIRSRVATRTIVYADPTAAGSNDGTSWTNAFTDLSTAIGAVTEGGVLRTNSTQANPFAASASIISTAASYVEWQTDAGADGETWISGAQSSASWVDAGGGVFSLAMASAPRAVAYNYTADDLAGTATGVDLTDAKIAAALAAQLSDSPWSAADAVAWSGALAEASSPTTTPADGEWSHTGGVLYINPPGTVTLGNVNSLTIWCDDRNLLRISDSVSHWHISGKLTGFFSASNSSGSGYLLRFTNADNVAVQGTRHIMGGYHAVGFVDSTRSDCVVLDLLATGYRNANTPLVFYNGSGADVPNARHKADRTTVVAWGLMQADGTPLEPDLVATLTYSHCGVDGGGAKLDLSGITYSRCLVLDMSGQVAAASAVANTTARVNPLWAADTGETPDASNPDSMGIKVRGLVILGGQAFPPGRLDLAGFYLDGMGYGDGATDQYSLFTTAPASGTHAWEFLLRDGLWLTGAWNTVFTAVQDNDHIWIEGCAILNNANFLTRQTAVNANALTISNSLLGGGILVQATPVVWAEADWNMDSAGGNILALAGAAVEHSSGSGVGTKTPTELLAAIDTSARDVVTDALSWV